MEDKLYIKWLTHESDDERWESYAARNNLPSPRHISASQNFNYPEEEEAAPIPTPTLTLSPSPTPATCDSPNATNEQNNSLNFF